MKSRLKIAMEANGVTVEELVDYLYEDVYRVSLGGSIFSCTKKRLIAHYKDISDNDISKMAGNLIAEICKFCNCSADYLLGLSEVINPVSN